MTEETKTLEPVSKVQIVESECEKNVELMEKFIDSGLSHEEFFDKFMANPELKEGELSSDEKSENDQAPASEEKSSEDQANESAENSSPSQDEEESEASLIDCFEVMGRFYVRAPDENGDVVKRIAQPGEKIAAEFISEEIISLNLVKKV